MREAVSIICFLILFVIILWIHNYSRRKKKEVAQTESFINWNKIKKFMKNTASSAFNWARNHANELRNRIFQEAQRVAQRAKELLNLRLEKEKQDRLNNMVNQFRDLLAKDFNYLDTIPSEVRERLKNEIQAAMERRRLFLEKQELDRKRSAYKVIMKLQELAKSLPQPNAKLDMTRIMEGTDASYKVNDIKGNDIKNTILERLRKPNASIADYDEIGEMVSMLREYNCNGDQWCFQNTSQWLYQIKP